MCCFLSINTFIYYVVLSCLHFCVRRIENLTNSMDFTRRFRLMVNSNGVSSGAPILVFSSSQQGLSEYFGFYIQVLSIYALCTDRNPIFLLYNYLPCV